MLTLEMVIKGLAMKYEGKTYDEISDTLGCSRATVTRWIPRAESILKKYYPLIRVEGGEAKQEDPISRVLEEQGRILEKIEEIQKKLEKIEEIIQRLPQGTS